MISALLVLHCSKEESVREVQHTVSRRDNCGQAQSDAFRLVLKSKYKEALQRYGDALNLCRDAGDVLDNVLFRIADIGRMAPDQCQKVTELFHQFPISERIDYLRSAVSIQHFCSSTRQISPYFDQLVAVETTVLYAPEGRMLRELVQEYESARLFKWARNPALHLQHLRSATQQLCKDDVLPVAIRTLERESGREDTPVGGTLGLWVIQPSSSFDERTRDCLSKAGRKIQLDLGHFPRETQRQFKDWLDWRQKHLAD